MKFNLVENKSFGYFSVSPLPTAEYLDDFYRLKYYQDDHGTYNQSYSKEELNFFTEDSKLLEFIYQKHFPKSSRKNLIDVGCGEGFQSMYFHAKHWNVRCLDYSDDGLKRHNPSLIDNFAKGNVNQLAIEDLSKYSLILLKNVLEHVIDPIETLHSLKELMDDQSLLFIEVPNDYSSFQNFLLEKKYTNNSWFSPPEHLHYFQFESLQGLLLSLGFEIVSVQSGFPIEQFLVNPHSNYALNRELGKNAHKARVEISNFLIEENLEDYIALKEAYAKMKFGRDIKIAVRLRGKV